jgi:hypothetical protein
MLCILKEKICKTKENLFRRLGKKTREKKSTLFCFFYLFTTQAHKPGDETKINNNN